MDSAGSRTITAGSEFHRPRSTLACQNQCAMPGIPLSHTEPVAWTTLSGTLQASTGTTTAARLRLANTGRPGPVVSVSFHYEIPYFAQSLVREKQIWLADTKPSRTTVDFTLCGVTQIGLSRMDRTGACSSTSVTLPLTRLDGGVMPARRYMASATAACASR